MCPTTGAEPAPALLAGALTLNPRRKPAMSDGCRSGSTLPFYPTQPVRLPYEPDTEDLSIQASIDSGTGDEQARRSTLRYHCRISPGYNGDMNKGRFSRFEHQIEQ